jgi:hypothetical protein
LKGVANSNPRPEPKVERVIVTTRPTESILWRTAKIGFYMVADDLVTLVDENGTPIKTEGGNTITAIVEPGTDPRAVASSLIYRRARNTIEGFNRRLVYPNLGLA